MWWWWQRRSQQSYHNPFQHTVEGGSGTYASSGISGAFSIGVSLVRPDGGLDDDSSYWTLPLKIIIIIISMTMQCVVLKSTMYSLNLFCIYYDFFITPKNTISFQFSLKCCHISHNFKLFCKQKSQFAFITGLTKKS